MKPEAEARMDSSTSPQIVVTTRYFLTLPSGRKVGLTREQAAQIAAALTEALNCGSSPEP